MRASVNTASTTGELAGLGVLWTENVGGGACRIIVVDPCIARRMLVVVDTVENNAVLRTAWASRREYWQVEMSNLAQQGSRRRMRVCENKVVGAVRTKNYQDCKLWSIELGAWVKLRTAKGNQNSKNIPFSCLFQLHHRRQLLHDAHMRPRPAGERQSMLRAFCCQHLGATAIHACGIGSRWTIIAGELSSSVA
ncbi:hypothetical protein FA95DRAFT_1578336 [Auriscalpium vulgare]|uniref:Uncharacterized protein n=1 Tax=Auriscalpium vulgare TaxID=40419 RepID=A0ACB8R2T0_9AGAM|nr:hypothetical protein FA95DRAFT_1578336 [Auriscalpium vulgare]